MAINDVADGPAAQLARALQTLHAQKGAPSVRALAQQIGDVSHTTVADALAGRRVPSWAVLEGIVHALDGDRERFKRLWADTREPAGSRSRAGAAPLGRQDDDSAGRYARQVLSHTDWLDLQDPGAGGRAAFDELYLPQRVVASDESQMDLRTFDGQLHRALLLGDRGTGLSTACRALMRWHAAEPGQKVPFLVQVREFAATIPPARSIVGHIEHVTETFFQVRPPEGALDRLLSAGQALVILDGLAEVAASAARAVASIIELFCGEYPQAAVLVTARSADTQDWLSPGLFAKYRLTGFTADQVVDYVHRWFTVASGVPDEDRLRMARTLLEQIALTPDTVSPLRIRLACQAYARDGLLPVNFPLAAPGSQRAAGLPDPHTSTAQAKILLVENEPEWLDLISRALPAYQVDTASSYSQAAELLQTKGHYDVALVDLNLMDSDRVDTQDQLGGELLRLLRTSYPATRRIAVTGRPPASARTVFDNFDVDDLMLKGSMTLADVRHAVGQALALASNQPGRPSAISSREPAAG